MSPAASSDIGWKRRPPSVGGCPPVCGRSVIGANRKGGGARAQRNYRRRVNEMQAIASRLWGPTSWWHPGGMAWQLATEQAPGIAHTWGEAAWAWMYQPDVLMLQVDAAAPELAPEVVAWFEAHNEGKSPRVEIADGEQHVVEAFVAVGYTEVPDEPFGLDQRARAEPRQSALPDGYRLVTAEEVGEDVRVEAHRAAWRPSALPYAEGFMPDVRPGDGSTFNAAKFRRVQQQALYAAERDLVIVTESGEPAACCTVWLDTATGSAEIEPLGVVPEHRRRGLAQMLCHAALDAVARGGGVEVVIHPRGDAAYPAPRAAYAAAGFAPVNRTRVYGR